MKHPPKPFAVEIKRSRRTPAPSGSLDLLAKDKSEFSQAVPALFAKSDLFSNAAPDSDFAIPAFLQTDKPAHKFASDSQSREAEQLFRPKPAANGDVGQPQGERPAPRILQSLVQEQIIAPDYTEQRAPEPRSPRQSRRRATGSPLQKAASKSRSVEKNDDRKKSAGDKAAHVAAPKDAIKRSATATVSTPVKNIKPAPALQSAEIVAPPAKDKARVLRGRGFARRGREDAASSLPPGQQWKRRLNPRVW